MLVYSGPSVQNKKSFNITYYKYFYNIILNRVGCIYTGDCNFNLINISDLYRKHWNNVGTVQIPHHGDKKCFSDSFFDNNFYFCPISVGTKNTYGHPSSSVISNIISKKCIPFVVTENPNSRLVQIIFIN